MIDLLRPLEIGSLQGFVFLGNRLTGTASFVFGLVFAGYLGLFAWGIWSMRRWAQPMSVAYATYVMVSLALFHARTPHEAVASVPMGAFCALVAISTAYVLTAREGDLV